MRIEKLSHKAGMFHRDTEAQPFYGIQIGDIAVQRMQNMFCPLQRHSPVERVQVGQFILVIAAADPAQVFQIDGICHTKILEGAEQFAVNGFRQTDFGGDPTSEIIQNVFAVHSFGGGGQAQQNLGMKMFQ